MSQRETIFGMDKDRYALAARLVREEMETRRIGATRLAINSGLSRATVSNFVNMVGTPSGVTLAAVELAGFDWPRGFLRAVVAGDLVRVASYEPTATFSAYIRDLAVSELRNMAMVVPVADDGDVARGNGDA